MVGGQGGTNWGGGGVVTLGNPGLTGNTGGGIGRAENAPGEWLRIDQGGAGFGKPCRPGQTEGGIKVGALLVAPLLNGTHLTGEGFLLDWVLWADSSLFLVGKT